ncbi:cobalamin B12-binding domain-containing protein [Streptomyces apricus]|uniref:Cobalamin B12-binding domain-containing protein n=1 Tax=Streptomyces apricus TaxID=1828112 RepID=A0A5B0BGJ2_9ACTN|nr:cobalamin-dependent protein [Streptomyces apricus]KAA0941150.1 cobalamin B12-binding domain-containing protein [Streptomyces apricus]
MSTATDTRSRRQDQLWQALSVGDEDAATRTLFGALEEGMDAENVLLGLIAPVQRRVGEEWAANRLTVAQEHAATAINDRALSALSHHHRTRTAPVRGRVLVACVDGEWHGLPARILAEVLKLRGWKVDYLGAQTPTPHLIAHVHQRGPQLVALSSSIPTRLPTAHATITAVQATGTPVLVGGAAFGVQGRYARLLGADAWAPDAGAAAERLEQGPLPRPAPARQPIDDLPHLADQEYTMVARTHLSLVRTVMDDLQDRFPAMRSYTPDQSARTAEDVEHIVQFLATALYTGDPDLFTDFLTWTAHVLTARDVPAHSLVPALDILTEQLKDFPRALHILTRATDHLSRTRPDHAAADDARNHA